LASGLIVSAASTSAALMMLLAHRYGWRMPGIVSLERMDGIVLVLELLVLIALVVSLGSAARAWLNLWGLFLLLGVVIAGLLVPIAMSWRQRRAGYAGGGIVTLAALVLLGGFLLRLIVIFSSEAIERTI
jgi:protein NrfD